jgi:hypothetical protein
MACLAEDAAFAACQNYCYIIQLLLLLQLGLRIFNLLQKALHSQKRPTHIHSINFLPELRRHLPDGVAVAFIGDTGVSAEDVDVAEVLDCGGYGGFYRVFVADVALDAVQVWVGVV